MWFRFGKPDPTMCANGLLAGLVAITAPCAFVNAPLSVLIGLIAGVLVVVSVLFIDGVLKVDDPVGAVSVHGVCGAWGILSLGLFADGTYGDKWNGVEGTVTGLFYGDGGQFLAQVINIFVNFIFVFVSAYLVFKLIEVVIGNRVSAEVELQGLDVPETGVVAYPDFVLAKGDRKETANGELG
jgi:Amt family ammonium transporter